MKDNLDDMYREIILDHYRAPRGKEPVEKADITSDGQNPSCGDEIELQVQMENGSVKNIHVNCQGCAISTASGSMLAEFVKGKTLDEVKKLSHIVKGMLKGETDEVPEEYEDLDALQGVRKFPVRIKCALLAWVTLIEGIKKYENGNGESKTSTTTEDESE